jgi:hypothetical protein
MPQAGARGVRTRAYWREGDWAAKGSQPISAASSGGDAGRGYGGAGALALTGDGFGKARIGEKVMLEMFVAALVSGADPADLARAPAGMDGSEVILVAQAQRYEKVYIACQDIDGIRLPSAYNQFAPFHQKLITQLGGPGAKYNSLWLEKVNPRVTLVEAPKHGKLEVDDAKWHLYHLTPDKDYLGEDRVVYEIEAQGKRYKVIINFWVVPVVMPDYQECRYKKFDGSSIDPASMLGEFVPVSNAAIPLKRSLSRVLLPTPRKESPAAGLRPR